MNILLIEDERKVAAAICQSLREQGWQITHALTGEEGYFEASQNNFDLILLDLMLPAKDGFEVLAALRGININTPVLILSARADLDARVQGLDEGADDYLVKPFAIVELHARIRALTRRGGTQLPTSLSLSDLQLDRLARRVIRAGVKLELTKLEFQILEYLMINRDQAVPRRMLAKEVWNQTQRVTPLDNVIDVHITRLRKKLDGNGQIKLLHTLRGVGYMLSESAP